jgi:hypothetical protein
MAMSCKLLLLQPSLQLLRLVRQQAILCSQVLHREARTGRLSKWGLLRLLQLQQLQVRRR